MEVIPEALRRALQKENVRSISRRYFISNGFDGTLTAIGIAMGSFLSGVPSGLTVVKIGAGAAVGLGTSGVWSVWEIERAEKLAERQRIERAMLTDLGETRIEREQRHARTINAIMSGIGPIIGIAVTISPFALEAVLITMFQATLISVLAGMLVLFIFGAYMGNISDQRWTIAGIRMGLAGLVVALINIILPG